LIGEFLSGSDDKTVKIWKGMFDLFKHCVEGACAETIDHPNTIWSVLSCTQEGTLLNNDIDIITACEDYCVRVFTRNKERIAPENELEEFVGKCTLNQQSS
jgi:WD40 repeat protein